MSRGDAILRAGGLIAGAACGVLAGCSVMTVDVDVYKGPLANTRHVQIEQMSVMAIGADVVLERLQKLLCAECRGLEDAFPHLRIASDIAHPDSTIKGDLHALFFSEFDYGRPHLLETAYEFDRPITRISRS